ncbi:acyl-CoA dehydrogenase family protein [Aquirhabdus parva]|uniref:Monooxygenase n=1 Tax=Aquirhabdus parva TaxID=2283318 RepID=A0A345P4L6_9GAMM|nr:acyl-CoA dehydrogenase family protein [Aquirhabdus parva]AXI02225.1 monooxygenase [Aquirhabdus parva]
MSVNQPKKPTVVTDSPILIATSLSEWLAQTVIERDRIGGTPKAERDIIRDSSLLTLSIPTQYGGLGGSWAETLETVRIIARADSSIAHVYAFQHLMLATVRLFGSPEQWEYLFEQTVSQNWFWGNALNPLDTRTVSVQHEGWRDFTGKKSFCSGALDSDMLIASARQDGLDRLVIAAIPTQRAGITLYEDWSNIGQRQTDSGSADFNRVRVEENEILVNPGPLGNTFATLRPLIAQLILSNVYLGIAEGAFNSAKHYTQTQARRWLLSTADRQPNDPYALERSGEFWVTLESARALNNRAAELLDRAWARDTRLTESERAEVAIAIATAKVVSGRGGLDITTRIFDIMGARSTAAELGFDRFWRNLRTYTLHDPIDYKIRELGDWTLNDQPPRPTFYS